MERKTNGKALLIGLIVDVAGTYVGANTAALAAVIGLSLFRSAQALADKAFTNSLALLLIELAFGLSFTVLGGYATATIAETEKLRHALGMGFLSVLVSLALMAFSPRQGPAWTYIAGCLLSLPVALLGGFLGSVLGKKKRLFEHILLSASILTFLWAVALGYTAWLIGRL